MSKKRRLTVYWDEEFIKMVKKRAIDEGLSTAEFLYRRLEVLRKC